MAPIKVYGIALITRPPKQTHRLEYRWARLGDDVPYIICDLKLGSFNDSQAKFV